MGGCGLWEFVAIEMNAGLEAVSLPGIKQEVCESLTGIYQTPCQHFLSFILWQIETAVAGNRIIFICPPTIQLT
jgi:hypothetical protein